MQSLSLFAGIGGIDLALEQIGITSTAFCDWDEYCQRVLKVRWPGAPVFGDIKDLDAQVLNQNGVKNLSMVTGSWPCQSHSVAGDRQGKDDVRHLWPEMARLLGELSPDYMLGENVDGFLSSSNGEAMGDLLSDMTAMDYRFGWACYPASDIGCAHVRNRVFAFGLRPMYDGWMPDKERVINCVIGWLAYSRWPALPGYYQRPFEPSRVVFADPGRNRRARVKAIGNAVAPFQVFPIALALVCRGDLNYLDFSTVSDEWLEACALTRLFDRKLGILHSCFALVRSALDGTPGKVFAHCKDGTWRAGERPFIGRAFDSVNKWCKWGYVVNKTACMSYAPTASELSRQFPAVRGDGTYGAVPWKDMNEALWRTPTSECGVKFENFQDKNGNPPSQLGVTTYRRNKNGEVAVQSVTLNQQVEMTHEWERALWATPAAYTTAGELPEYLVNAHGLTPQPGEKLYRIETGRMVQTALTTQVKMWPGENGDSIAATMSRDNLWSTPKTGTVYDSKGCVDGMKKGGLPIEQTVVTENGKRAMLNPDWEEVLMGFPVGWSEAIEVPQ